MIDEKLQMYNLYKEFSSRFCALDFRGMVCEQLDINAKKTPGLLLKVDSHRNEYIAFLQEHNYPKLNYVNLKRLSIIPIRYRMMQKWKRSPRVSGKTEF